MSKTRILFEKKGKAKYISHLDLMRTMQRVFLRAGLKIKHTEGFNPHPYIVFCLPMSVGAESICELMDFDLVEDMDLSIIPEKLTSVMPEGITVKKAYPVERKFREMEWLKIEGFLFYDGEDAESKLEPLTELFKRKELVITRKTKRGMGEADIAPMINKISFEAENNKTIKFEAIIHAQEPTLNPAHIIEAIRTHLPEAVPDFYKYTRMELYDKEFKVFR